MPWRCRERGSVVITREEADRLRDQLLAVLEEDAHNAERLLARLEAISTETGIGAHAALLLILCRLAFEDGEARTHWNRIVAHRAALSRTLGRDIGVRVALFDYFINVNRRLVQPTLIDLEMYESGETTGQNDQTWLDRAGNHHSEQLRVVERFTPTSPHTLAYEATLEDEKVFTQPWKLRMTLYRLVGDDAVPQRFNCVEFVEELIFGHLRKEPLDRELSE